VLANPASKVMPVIADAGASPFEARIASDESVIL